MKAYTEKIFFLNRYWGWFSEPHDIPDVSMSTFFSYADNVFPGFTRKESLTTVIDLSASLETIWGEFRKKFIREQIEKGERQGIIAQESRDFESFRKIYKTFAKEKSISSVSISSLEKNGILFLASYQGSPIAGGVFIGDGTSIRAWVLASVRMENPDGPMRETVGRANRMVIWEAIKHAKADGYTLFDLGGLNLESQQSLAEFKEGFGGVRKRSFYYQKTYLPFLSWASASGFASKVRGLLK